MAKKDEGSQGAPEWMVTYGDLVTLLMCFFVLLFAFSEIDAQKFTAIMQSFQSSPGVLDGGSAITEDEMMFDAQPENDTSPPTTDVEQLEIIDDFLEKTKQKIEDELEGEEYEESVEVAIESNKLIIRFTGNVLFDSAKADIKEEAIPLLLYFGEMLSMDEFAETDISIDGHTDNVPINTLRFPSNWELSSARATNVLKYFVDALSFTPYRLSTSGYGEFRPIDTNDTAEGRAQNRRVEIIIEKFTAELLNDIE